MTAAFLALAASLSWGVADFLGGLTSRRVALLAVLALAQPAGLAALGLAVLIAGDGPRDGGLVWAVPAAALGTIGIAAFYRGMATGAISVVAPIAATGAAIPVAAGIALGDEVSAAQAIGFTLAIGGVVVASVETGGELGRARLSAGVPWGLLAALGFGGYFVPMHEASEEQFLWAALIFRATAVVLIVAAVVALRPPFAKTRANLAAIVLIGILDSGGNLFFAAAASVGAVSVTAVLASLYPVVTVALAWAYLRERVGPAQTLGVVAALAGVALITAG